MAMKHTDQITFKLDMDELKGIIHALGPHSGAAMNEVRDRMCRIAYPEQYPDPIEKFHDNISYYEANYS